jgi:hypothetical protein
MSHSHLLFCSVLLVPRKTTKHQELRQSDKSRRADHNAMIYWTGPIHPARSILSGSDCVTVG